jgi:DNA-3-methyladenine glycosylase
MSDSRLLPQEFYARETTLVAEALLGKRLVHRLENGQRLSGRIVEVEAYLGVEDPAAHTHGGRRTPRNEAMYGEAGFTYVYFIYGIHNCVNVVTQIRDVPEAVLLRALEPVEGFTNDERLNGPGKLCAGLKITRELNSVALFDPKSSLFIEDDISISQEDIAISRRVGIEYAGDAVYWPLRFGIRGNGHLSPTKFDEG